MATQNASKTPARTQPTQKTTLTELEQTIAKALAAEGVSEVTSELIAKHGDPVVAAGELNGYTPARYSDGRWVSRGVVARVAALVAAAAPSAT